MKKPVLILSVWLLASAPADARADRLFATHFSIWNKSVITEFDPQTGALLNSYPTPATPNQNAGLAFDGTYLYFLSGRNPTYNTIYKLNPNTGATVSQYDLPDNPYRTGLTIIGEHLYATDWHPHHNNVEVFDLATGTPVGTISFKDANPAEPNLMIDAGLGAIRDPDALLATCHPVGRFTPGEILELDPVSGVIRSRFDILDADANNGAQGLAAIGNEIFLGIHAIDKVGDPQIVVYNRDGVEQRRFGVYGSTGVQALAAGPGNPVPEPPTLIGLAALAAVLSVWAARRRQGPAVRA